MPCPNADDAAQPPALARTLGFLLREAYARLQERVYEAVTAAGHPGLRATHSAVLRHLPAAGGRVADLSLATGLAKQSIAYVVEDLVELGYLRTGPDPDDGRARRITYTARGLRLLDALVAASRDAESELAAGLGATRLRALRDTLESVLAAPRPAAPAAPPGSARRRRRGRTGGGR